MARPQNGPRIYTRTQGGATRYYGDFRSHGGKQEALIADGELRATTDPVIAQKLFTDRLGKLQEAKRNRVLLGVQRVSTLEEYASEHLIKKRKSGRVTTTSLETNQVHFGAAVEFFGADRDVASIQVEDVQRYAEWLTERTNRRGGRLAPGTQRGYLNSLSNLFRRAQGEGLLRGANPVAALMDKPTAAVLEAEWLEVWEGALLLESARTFPRYQESRGTMAGRLTSALEGWGGGGDFAFRRFLSELQQRGRTANEDQVRRYLSGEGIPTKDFLADAAEILGVEPAWLHNTNGEFLRPLPKYAYALLATFLLTGGRESEVTGLELGDISFRRKTVTFRPNQWRGLKTRTSHRTIPLWPQLEAVLDSYLSSGERTTKSGLLFASEVNDGVVVDFRKSLDKIAGRVGWKPGEVRTKAFRHTYCAARLQTLDRGFPVAEYTVGKEMGHGGFALVRKVYGHLGRVRHRSEVVEFHLDQQSGEIPAERIRLLEAV